MAAAIMPLDQLPSEHRALIEREAAQEMPPPRWRTCSDGLAQVISRGWYEWHVRRGKCPTTRSGHRIAERLRRQVIARDGDRCGLCGGTVAAGELHVDHIFPVSLGGRDVLSNLQVAHASCNVRKGNRV